MSRRGGAKKHEGGGHGSGKDRWMASYMDMVTVLMCLFIVLFAMSSVDQTKYQKLKNSLAEGFGKEEVGAEAPTLVLVEDQEVEEAAEADLQVLQQRIETALQEKGMGEAVEFEMDRRGLTVRLVSTETFFKTNSDDLTSKARKLLGIVGPELAASGRELSVEGHADYRRTAAPYETNWDLSAARAVTVLRDLVEERDVDPADISATAFGEAQPVAKGRDAKSLGLNRRVDIVVLSGAAAELPAGASEAGMPAAEEAPATADSHDAQAAQDK